MSELRRRGGEGKGAEGGDGDASGHPAQRAVTWPSPLSQCCLCNTMLVVQPIQCPSCQGRLGCATVNGSKNDEDVVIPENPFPVNDSCQTLPEKRTFCWMFVRWIASCLIVVFLALCLMAVSPYLRLGLISNGIRDTKDFFVYAALGTDDKYIGYELKKGEVLDVIEDPGTAEEFNLAYGIPRKPVVIRCKDGIDKRFGWSTAKWDLDYLAETIGDTHVQVETPANPLDQGTMHGVLPEMLNISFKDYVRELQEPLSEKTRSMYLNLQKDARDTVFSTPLPKLSNEIWIPSFISTRAVHDANMWLGRSKWANGTRSRMHCDGSDNLYVLLKGKKKLRIFSPSQVIHLDTFGAPMTIEPQGNIKFLPFTPIKSTTFTGLFESVRSMIKVPDAGPHFSKLNSDYINPETNPTFTDAISTVVELEEGDMLWMPSGWFHEVTSYDVHLALNFWVYPPQFGR